MNAEALNDGGPAFPADAALHKSYRGLSMRDWFAGMALQGQLTCMGNQAEPDKRAVEAYKFADVMLAARSKQGEGV